MPKTEVIKKSNALIEAAYNPKSLYQMRLLLVAISQIREGQKITPDTVFLIDPQGMADQVGISPRSGSLYSHLAKAADDLMEMIVTVTERPDGKPRSKRYWKINVVDSCEYIVSESTIALRFTYSIIPYITALENRYKAYKLETVIKMKSMYGIRLYELCLAWIFPDGFKEITVKEFRRLMGLDDKYTVIADVKKWVLKPALRDINKCSELKVTYNSRKTGRTITWLQFTIKKKPKEPVATRRGRPPRLTKAYIEQHAMPGESWEAAERRLRLEQAAAADPARPEK